MQEKIELISNIEKIYKTETAYDDTFSNIRIPKILDLLKQSALNSHTKTKTNLDIILDDMALAIKESVIRTLHQHGLY